MKYDMLEVVECEIIEEEIDVVNFTCEPHHYYISNDIVSHNCDTPYAIEGKDFKKLPVETVVNTILSFDCTDVTFTGGEPFLYLESIKTIMDILNATDGNFTYNFETNGIICNPRICQEYNPTIVVSPKLHALSGDYINSIEGWGRASGDICFKFVYENSDTIEQIKKLEKALGDKSIYLMPEGIKFDNEKYEECAQKCIENGYIMSPRLHNIIWGNKRGV